MSSGAMIYVSSFLIIGLGIQKLMAGFTDTQTAWRSHKRTFMFLNKEGELKMENGLKCFSMTITDQ
jgi:hypothetical protein